MYSTRINKYSGAAALVVCILFLFSRVMYAHMNSTTSVTQRIPPLASVVYYYLARQKVSLDTELGATDRATFNFTFRQNVALDLDSTGLINRRDISGTSRVRCGAIRVDEDTIPVGSLALLATLVYGDISYPSDTELLTTLRNVLRYSGIAYAMQGLSYALVEITGGPVAIRDANAVTTFEFNQDSILRLVVRIETVNNTGTDGTIWISTTAGLWFELPIAVLRAGQFQRRAPRRGPRQPASIFSQDTLTQSNVATQLRNNTNAAVVDDYEDEVPRTTATATVLFPFVRDSSTNVRPTFVDGMVANAIPQEDMDAETQMSDSEDQFGRPSNARLRNAFPFA